MKNALTSSSDHNNLPFIKDTKIFLLAPNYSIQHFKMKYLKLAYLLTITPDPDIQSCDKTVAGSSVYKRVWSDLLMNKTCIRIFFFFFFWFWLPTIHVTFYQESHKIKYQTKIFFVLFPHQSSELVTGIPQDSKR